MNQLRLPTIVLSLVTAFAFIGAAPGSSAGPTDILLNMAGDTEECKCCGAGRCATCSGGNCACDFDWQGYPRCVSGGDFFLLQ